MKKVFGIGINDYNGKVSYFEFGNQKFIKSYSTWRNMLQRCYSNKYHEITPTYKGCSVDEKWLSYSNFKKWFDNNYPFELSEQINFSIDKDLLTDGNKIYSEYNCIFVPVRINSFLSNKYSKNKSGCIGVTFVESRKKFSAQINLFENKKVKNLGYFEHLEEANIAYVVARRYNSLLARNYMIDLGIYSEEIINKIK